MTTDVQSLLLKIDASTELARRELNKMGGDFDRFDRRSEETAARAESNFNKFGDAAKGAAATLAAAFGGTAALRYLVDTTAAFETLQARLEVATGSIDGASLAFDALKQLASETPFSLQEVTDAFILLKNLGLDPSRAAIISYGNTAAALGKTLDDVVQAVADAATGEFERLKEFGIKASAEGDKVALTFKGVTTEVGRNATEIEGYLRRIGETDFAGSLEKQSQTLNGALSNLGDSVDQLAVSLTGLGFSDAFLQSIKAVSAAFDGIRGQIEGLKRIFKDSGLGGLLTSSGNDALNSATASGRRGLLEQDVNRQFLSVQESERAQKRGGILDQLGAGAAPELAQRRARLAAAERRLAEFERANAAELKREAAARTGGDPLSAFASKPASAGGAAPARARAATARRTPSFSPADLRAGLDRVDGALPFGDLGAALVDLDAIAVSLDGISAQAVDLSNVDVLDYDALGLGVALLEDASFALTDALITGQSLGDTLVNTFTRAGASLLQSGLLNLLSGGKAGTSFADAFKGISSLFSGQGFANGGRPPVGRISVVGERGPELFVPRVPGTIIPNHLMGGGGRGQSDPVQVQVEASPLLIATVVGAASQAAQSSAAEQNRRASRPRLPGGFG